MPAPLHKHMSLLASATQWCQIGKGWGLESGSLSVVYQLCDFGQTTLPLCVKFLVFKHELMTIKIKIGTSI